jgi:hypothetical protein
MQLVAPDVLEAGVGLSPIVCGVGLVVGVLLWCFGGLGHRFWVVLGGTLIAGVVGLRYGKHLGMEYPLVAGLLLAVSVGSLALALFRILLFVASGFAVAWLTSVIFPSWEEQIACFLAGGLLGIALYRLCVTTLASFGGTLLMVYSGLCLAGLFKVDVVELARKNEALCNWGIAALTVVGMLVQFLIQRRRGAPELIESEEEEESKSKKKEKKDEKSWFGWARQAG